MKKVFLEDLPKQNGYNGKRIDWYKSIGKVVKFTFENINGEVIIIDFNTKTQIIKFLYNQLEYELNIGCFKQCQLSFVLNVKTHDFKYKIGDIIKTKTGNIKIIDCFKWLRNYGREEKAYKYECLVDGNIDNIKESELFRGAGCNVCHNKKIIKGVNDVNTTNPDLIKYFVNIEDSYKYSHGSRVRLKMICPICDFKKSMDINTLTRQGFGCNNCGDGVSYPNKFVSNIIKQLNTYDYIPEKSFDWSKNKKYDFYIKQLNCIIEAHGGHHYDGGFSRANGKSLLEEQENDKLKEQLAKENGIENYIIIDCRKSDLDFIKNNILSSDFSKLIDLNYIDWLKCHEYASSSLIKTVCELWESGIINTQIISELTKLHRSTVIKNLHRGTKLGWCNYDSKNQWNYAIEKMNKKSNKQVICLNNGLIYKSLTEASLMTQSNISSISQCCKGKQKSAGKHPVTGEPLKWMYYKEVI